MENINEDLEYDIVRESLTENISLDVIETAMERQLGDPLNNMIHTDQFGLFNKKINDDIKSGNYDNNYREDILDRKEEITLKVLEDIKDKFGIGFDLETVNIYDISEVLYNFFIFNYKSNLVNFYTSYIYKNRKHYHKDLSDTNKKDVANITYRKIFKDNKDALILTNMYSIISKINTLEILPLDVIKHIHSVSSDPISEEVFRLFVKTGMISHSEDFFDKFIELFTDELDYNIGIIVNEVSESLFELLPKLDVAINYNK